MSIRESIIRLISVSVSFVLGVLTIFMLVPTDFISPFYTTGFWFGLAFLLSLDSLRSFINQYTSKTIFTWYSTLLAILVCVFLGLFFVPIPSS